MKPKKLLYKKNASEYYQRFFGSLKQGDFFTYGEAWTPQEIKMLAARHGTTVMYCAPKTAGYILHGSQVMEVMSRSD